MAVGPYSWNVTCHSTTNPGVQRDAPCCIPCTEYHHDSMCTFWVVNTWGWKERWFLVCVEGGINTRHWPNNPWYWGTGSGPWLQTAERVSYPILVYLCGRNEYASIIFSKTGWACGSMLLSVPPMLARWDASSICEMCKSMHTMDYSTSSNRTALQHFLALQIYYQERHAEHALSTSLAWCLTLVS
jgi:hypothetical protein